MHAVAIRYREMLILELVGCARARFPYEYYTDLSELRDEARRAPLSDNNRNAKQAPKPAHGDFRRGGPFRG